MRSIKFGLALSIWLTASGAWALTGDTDGNFGLDGSVRALLLGAGTKATPEGMSQGNLRWIAQGSPQSWLSYEVHAVGDFSLKTGAFSRFYVGERGRLRNRSADTRYVWLDNAGPTSDVHAYGYIDRANIKLKFESLDITLGRQAITFGTAYFWNPLDVFGPFTATQFDRDFKNGVDALRIDAPIGEFSGLSAVGVVGRGNYEQRWLRSTLLVRGYTTVAGWDATIQGGKVFGGYQLGAGVVGDIEGLEIRSEASWYSPVEADSLPEHLTAVFGAGYRFENTLYLSAEYLYNGAVLTEPLQDNEMGVSAHMSQGRLLHGSGHLVGAILQYELMPILQSSAAALFSLSDSSYLIQPGLTLSISDESDVVVGAIIPQGDSGTEFGGYPVMGYMQMKSYF